VYKLAEYVGKEILGRIVSMYKVFSWVQGSDRLIRLIKGTLPRWEKDLFKETVQRSMCMQSRNRKTTLESICEGEFYYSRAA
jgi:hypothetical protein